MKEAIGDPVVAELKRITKLLALSLVKNEALLREQIKLLDQYDFSQKEISEMLHIPLGTVGSNLARAKQSELKKGQVKKS
jgi:DNA-directed RNA polymerase specialized sigma24 family protein